MRTVENQQLKKRPAKELREGTKRLFPNEFEEFTLMALDAARKGELPVFLELGHLGDYRLKDFEDMMDDFYRKTGLEIDGLLSFSCSGRKMTVSIKVDWPDKEEAGTWVQ